jgi:hypothetical protein
MDSGCASHSEDGVGKSDVKSAVAFFFERLGPRFFGSFSLFGSHCDAGRSTLCFRIQSPQAEHISFGRMLYHDYDLRLQNVYCS